MADYKFDRMIPGTICTFRYCPNFSAHKPKDTPTDEPSLPMLPLGFCQCR